jgi:uncharacterized membrane protein YsdA (DUF1294 family)
MPISHDDAAEALREIDRTQQRSSVRYGYRAAAPQLIVWGLIWAAGYGADYFRPEWRFTWPVLIIVAMALSFWLGARDKSSSADDGWRYGATLLAIAIFIGALFSVMQPVSKMQVGAFFPLLVGLFYAIIGIWTRGMRMLVAGGAITALTLVGFFALPEYFLLWMAIVGGGGLILGGLWLSRA